MRYWVYRRTAFSKLLAWSFRVDIRRSGSARISFFGLFSSRQRHTAAYLNDAQGPINVGVYSGILGNHQLDTETFDFLSRYLVSK